MLEAWQTVLADVADDPLQAAAAEYLKSDAKWRPAPGELRALAVKASERAHWQGIADRSTATPLLCSGGNVWTEKWKGHFVITAKAAA